MTAPLKWSCRCGETRIAVLPGEGTRLVCYCASCQMFPKLFGRGDILTAAGGTELYQTLPDLVRLEAGAAHLGRLKLTDKGPLRWVATCCGTPLANTAGTVQVPFASIVVAGFDAPEALGTVRAHVNTDAATGAVPESPMSLGQLTRQVLFRALKARLRGRHHPSPFFTPEGRAAGTRVEITDEMRARA